MERKEEVRSLALGYPVGRRGSVSQGPRKKWKTKISKRDDERYVFVFVYVFLHFLVTELNCTNYLVVTNVQDTAPRFRIPWHLLLQPAETKVISSQLGIRVLGNQD